VLSSSTRCGGKIKTFNTLKTLALSKKFKIFAVFVSERSAAKAELEKFKKLVLKPKFFKQILCPKTLKKIILN
jgi:hypothetical protein